MKFLEFKLFGSEEKVAINMARVDAIMSNGSGGSVLRMGGYGGPDQGYEFNVSQSPAEIAKRPEWNVR